MPAESKLNPQRINQLAFAYAAPLMIAAGVENRVFDVLDAGPKTAAEAAQATGASPRGVRTLLDGLIGIELVAKDADGRYRLTPESAAFLVSGKPDYRGEILRHMRQLIPKWMQLSDIVRSGKPATMVNDEGDGSAFFAGFVEAIFPNSYPAAKALADHLQVAGAASPLRVLDLAAGSGVWGIALAEKSPRVQVTAVDWQRVLPVTKKVATQHGVADRFTFKPGDLGSADFGSGYDIATLGHILHSEGPAASQALLKKTFAALAPGGRIAIAEMLRNDDDASPPHALIFAVNMLVNTEDGDTFSFTQISSWLRDAGFTNPRLLEVPGPSPLILADKGKL